MKKVISIALLASFVSMNFMPVLAVENNDFSTASPKQFKSMVKKNKKTKNSDDYKFAYVNMNWWDNFNDDLLNSYIEKEPLPNIFTMQKLFFRI